MQTIDIKTTQNVAIEYELASLRDRLLAVFIDFIVIEFTYYILLFLLMSATNGDLASNSIASSVLYGVLPIAVFVGYQFLSELFANGQSWGKKSMRLKVVKTDGSEAGLGDYLIRSVFYIIDGFLSLGVIGSLSILSSSKRQRIGDYAANTTVIRLRSRIHFELNDILNIDSLEAYEPTYPQVRQLSEPDMLLIKTTITRYQQHRNEAHREAILQLTDRLEKILDIPASPNPKIEFLKTLIRDYIVLTR